MTTATLDTPATVTAPAPPDGHHGGGGATGPGEPEVLPHQVALRVVLPPYDDERVGVEDSPTGPLAVVLPLVFPAPARSAAALGSLRSREPVAGSRPSQGWRPDPAIATAPPPAPTSKLAALAITGIVEVLTNRRPARHLRGLAAPEVVARLERRARLLSARADPGRRPRLRRLRLSQPEAGSVEIAAVLALGEHCKALAMRMDWTGSAWLITAVEGF